MAASEVSTEPPPRQSTGHRQLDQLLGGGVVVGSAVLIYGKRGAGKSRSTFRLAARRRCLVCHPEMSLEITAAIIRDTGADPDRCLLWPNLENWQAVASREGVSTVVLDSLSASDAPVAEIRSAQQWAQARSAVVWCINHATKSGDFRGDSALAHWADYELRARRTKRASVVLDVLKQRLGDVGSVTLPLRR